jgi:hypothetical protein
LEDPNQIAGIEKSVQIRVCEVRLFRLRDEVAEITEFNAFREGLWSASSVGVIGGTLKCSKTWLGLDMALSVATGTPCLGRYAIPNAVPC